MAVLAALVVGASASIASADEWRIARLVRQLGAESFEERERATRELLEIGGPALAALRDAAASTDAEIARRAKACIPEIERNERGLSAARALKSWFPQVRAAAADELTRMAGYARRAVPHLVEALDDPDPNVRLRVFVALRHIGKDARSAVPKLVRIIKDDKATVDDRYLAATDLGAFYPTPEQVDEVVPILLRWLAQEDCIELQTAAAMALGAFGRREKRAVPALIRALDHPRSSVHVAAAASLAILGKEPEIAVPAIMAFLKKHKGDPAYAEARSSVILFLADFGAPALGMILDTAKDKDEFLVVRRGAIRALGNMGTAAREVAPVLRDMMKREGERRLSREIEDVLPKIEGPPK
jgi:HEAT repeat protein